jgi:hypothetical protein
MLSELERQLVDDLLTVVIEGVGSPAKTYECEHGLAIDVINGGPLLREWVDHASATLQDLDALADERAWLRQRYALTDGRYPDFFHFAHFKH